MGKIIYHPFLLGISFFGLILCTPSVNNDDIIMKEEFIYQKAPFKSCHASTVEATPRGMVAAWFGGPHEKHREVEIWLSRKQNGTWEPPRSVANGKQNDNERYPCWNPVLYQVPDGPLILFYKVGPNPEEWWGMMKTSSDGGKTWSEGKKLPEGILGPIKNKPVLLKDGRLICPSSTEHQGWRVHFEITPDFGETWNKVGPINDGEQYGAIQPSVLQYGSGNLQILCRSRNGVLLSSWSEDGGKSWNELKPSGLPNPNSGTDAVTLDNGWQLLVYNHASKPESEWGGPRTPLNVAVSKDGKTWKAAGVLENEKGEYSYPAVIQDSDGMVHITYTWKREKVKHVVLDPEVVNLQQLPEIKGGKWPDQGVAF